MLIEGVTWRVPLLPALATAAVLTAVLLALNLYEAWLVRTSHALPLLRWPGGGGEPARIPELADALTGHRKTQ